jgi:hypothetical protein
MNPVFCWFSFRRDASILLHSVFSIANLYPEAPKFVFDDNNMPLPPRVRNLLMKHGVNVIGTSFNRNGNLRGWICAYKISECYTWLKNVTKCNVLVKVDSDVIWLKKGWLEEFFESPCIFGGMRSKCRRGICGTSYALKPEGIDLLAESYKNELESPYATEEDFEINQRLAKAKKSHDDNVFFKVPYSFWGVYPETPDARGLNVDWGQNCLSFIKENMEVVSFAYDPPIPDDCKLDKNGQPVATKNGWALWHRARVIRARFMKLLLK